MRLEGVAGLRYSADDPETSDVDLRSRVVWITAKGRRDLILPIGARAARDIDRHIPGARRSSARGRRVALARHKGAAHGERRGGCWNHHCRPLLCVCPHQANCMVSQIPSCYSPAGTRRSRSIILPPTRTPVSGEVTTTPPRRTGSTGTRPAPPASSFSAGGTDLRCPPPGLLLAARNSQGTQPADRENPT